MKHVRCQVCMRFVELDDRELHVEVSHPVLAATFRAEQAELDVLFDESAFLN